MFVRRKGAGVNVDVWINLDGCHVKVACLHEGTNAGSNDTLADAADHSARHQDVLHPAFPVDAVAAAAGRRLMPKSTDHRCLSAAAAAHARALVRVTQAACLLQPATLHRLLAASVGPAPQ